MHLFSVFIRRIIMLQVQHVCFDYISRQLDLNSSKSAIFIPYTLQDSLIRYNESCRATACTSYRNIV